MSNAGDADHLSALSADLQTADQKIAATDQTALASADVAGIAQQVALAPTTQASPTVDAAPARAVSDTVANLSAQIAQKTGGQTSRFDVQLDPLGLGRVNVSVEIDAKGAMSAALSFEKPEAASLLKSHASELQQSLAQAGFNLADASLSFSTAAPNASGSAGQSALLGGGAGGGQQSQGGQAQNAGRLFSAASSAADQADQINTAARTLSARGLDIRI